MVAHGQVSHVKTKLFSNQRKGGVQTCLYVACLYITESGIGAVVKVVDSHLCG